MASGLLPTTDLQHFYPLFIGFSRKISLKEKLPGSNAKQIWKNDYWFKLSHTRDYSHFTDEDTRDQVTGITAGW